MVGYPNWKSYRNLWSPEIEPLISCYGWKEEGPKKAHISSFFFLFFFIITVLIHKVLQSLLVSFSKKHETENQSDAMMTEVGTSFLRHTFWKKCPVFPASIYNYKITLGVVLSCTAALLSQVRAWEPDMVVHACNYSTQEVEAAEWEVQGQPELQETPTLSIYLWTISQGKASLLSGAP